MAKRVLPPPAQICSMNNETDLLKNIFDIESHEILKLTLIVLAIVAQDYIVLFFKKEFQLQCVCVRVFFCR